MGQVVIANILFITLCYLAGLFVRPLFIAGRIENRYAATLERLFFGALAIAFLFAVFIARFNTVLLLVLPLLAYLLLERHRATGRFYDKPDTSGFWQDISVALVVVLFFIAWQWFRYYHSSPEVKYIATGDYFYYVNVADKFRELHTEGSGFTTVVANDLTAARKPYHYFDLWLLSFLRFAFSLTAADTYILVFAPFAFTLVFYSIASIMWLTWAKDQRNSLLIFFLSLALVFPFPLRLPPFLLNGILLDVPKFFVGFVFIALAIIYLKQLKLLQAAAVFCLLPVLHILAAPPVFITVFTIGVYLLVAGKTSLGWRLLAISTITAALIISYYLALGNFGIPNMTKAGGQAAINDAALPVLSEWEQVVSRYLAYVPVLVILMYPRRLVSFIRKEKKVLFLLLVLYVVSVVVAMLVAGRIFDGPQSRYVPGIGILYLVFAMWLAHVLSASSAKARIIFICLLSLIFCINISTVIRPAGKTRYISRAFFNEVEKYLPDSGVIAFAYNQDVRSGIVYHPYICQFNLQFPYYYNKSFALIPMSALSTTMPPQTLLLAGDMYTYIKNNPVKGADIYAYQLNFFKEYKIRYLVLDKGLDTNLFYIDLAEKRFRDPVSGISFYIIK